MRRDSQDSPESGESVIVFKSGALLIILLAVFIAIKLAVSVVVVIKLVVPVLNLKNKNLEMFKRILFTEKALIAER